MLLKKEYGPLPIEAWSPDLSAEDEFNRYVALRVPEAVALAWARSIETVFVLLVVVAAIRRRAHPGEADPLRHGAVGLPRAASPQPAEEVARGKPASSALRGPDGYELLGADFNAFEARILAALSGDPVLMAAANAPDMHADMATRLSARFVAGGDHFTRDEAKLGVYSIIYGQRRQGLQATPDQPQSHWVGGVVRRGRVACSPTRSTYRDQEVNQFEEDQARHDARRMEEESPNEAPRSTRSSKGSAPTSSAAYSANWSGSSSAWTPSSSTSAHDEVVVASRPVRDTVAQILATSR